MGEVNNIVCDYLGLPGYYADFWNGTVFRGKRKIKIWQLQRHDREYYKSKNKKEKTGNVRRDVQMRCKGKKDVLLGVELLDTLDYTIPVRVMDYNAQELRRQIKDLGQKNRQEKNIPAGTFLYGLKKTDKLLPVHTIGLYCGEETYETSLREIIAIFKRNKDREAMKQYYRVEGILITLCDLVKDGLLKLEDAAKKANMSEEVFFKKMQEINS